MALTVDEREQFLAEPHIAALAVVSGQDRGPLTVPMWYQYTPGGEAWILTGVDSRKTALLKAAGRFTLMVDRVTPTIRYVSAEGPVTRIVPGTTEHLQEMAGRYVPEDKRAAYVEVALGEHGEQVAIFMRPERWVSSDLGSL
ncbi:pyridoxamine 5'-phosphate oxidase family protein [Actinopolymorpha sp. B17G11]|uniref:pyridoxamine 5'-phosphate oxidase family protein n=1 Tax=Actinopolymorpha sp. B17G11 TaxID=3160861 RepID=UPI0032E4175B